MRNLENLYTVICPKWLIFSCISKKVQICYKVKNTLSRLGAVIYWIHKSIGSIIEALPEPVLKFKKELLHELNVRFSYLWNDGSLLCCALLDPHTKKMKQFSENLQESIKKYISNVIVSLDLSSVSSSPIQKL